MNPLIVTLHQYLERHDVHVWMSESRSLLIYRISCRKYHFIVYVRIWKDVLYKLILKVDAFISTSCFCFLTSFFFFANNVQFHFQRKSDFFSRMIYTCNQHTTNKLKIYISEYVIPFLWDYLWILIFCCFQIRKNTPKKTPQLFSMDNFICSQHGVYNY